MDNNYIPIDPDADLAAKLRALRASYGKTQAQVAEELGLKQQTYSNYEKKGAKIDSVTLKKICEHYGISADDLIGVTSRKATVETEIKQAYIFSNKPAADKFTPPKAAIETEIKQAYNITDKQTLDKIIEEVYKKLNTNK